jgi:hypothetical protein
VTFDCVVGGESLIVHKTNHYVNVMPFMEALKGLHHRPIISVELAFDDLRSGEMICLIIHQAIYIEEMKNNLLCPMQMWMHDVKSNECHKLLAW